MSGCILGVDDLPQNIRLMEAVLEPRIAFHDEWNTMLCQTAEQDGFRCADIYHAFNGPDGSKASGELLAEDYTHPSDKGNAKIAEVLVELGYQPLI